MKQKLLLLTFAFLSFTTSYSQESLDYKTTESYDSFTDTYSLSEKEEYTYYPNGELKMIEYFNWNVSSWENDNYRDEYYYDANGNLKDNVFSSWDASTSLWKNEYKTTTDYTNNIISKQTYSNWDGTQWVPEDRTDLHYVANKLDTYDSYEWNGSQWLNDVRGTFNYNAGRISSYTTDEFITGSWILLTDKNIFTRNGTGKIEEQIYQEDIGSGLQNVEKYNYSIDTNGNRMDETDSSSDDGTTWNPNFKTEYTYDMGVLITSYYHPFNINSFLYDLDLENFPHYNKVLTSKEYYYNSGWELTNLSTYHYSDDILGVEKLNVFTNVNIYPNPVRDVLNIKLENQTKADASLFDINGRLILRQKLQGLQTPINLESLNSGIYVLKIQTENSFATKRIVKN